MVKQFITPLIILSLSSCMKLRECNCYNETGVFVGTVRVRALSDEKAIEKCQIRTYGGDKKKAREAIAANPPDCRIE